MVKTCRNCGAPKPLDDFAVDRSRRDGHTSVCKPCDAARLAGYYSANRERILARANARCRARRAASGRARQATCATCEQTFTTARANQRYCTPTCRRRRPGAWRRPAASERLTATAWIEGHGRVELRAMRVDRGLLAWCPRCNGCFAATGNLHFVDLIRGITAGASPSQDEIGETVRLAARWPATQRICTRCTLHVDLDPLPAP